ncbi:hypothetical protein PR202_gb09378 [Eleusine coracana subsp. coracana]|uniref:RING-type domain-containing protein n=1 Tax=Eleusine coracana subsp. coracana TaxID=191504 RepID=A0AAV5EGB5_ELECO|nr:hypothetical protein PR202_gb09378 [Eleusine coracana subsp. coracana]
MGFPLVCYCVAIPKPLITFCKFICAVRDAVLLMLAVVGLCRFQPDGSVAAADGPLPEDVKRRLPAIEYAQLLAEHQQQQQRSGGDHASCRGIVCLERMEASDDVRRLGGCAHAFHRACIDRWIDLGRATCPLCRSSLLPRARPGPARNPPHAPAPLRTRAFGG